MSGQDTDDFLHGELRLRHSMAAMGGRRRLQQRVAEPAPGPADPGQHGAQRDVLHVGGFLMGEPTHDHQQEGFAEFHGQPIQRSLQRCRQFVLEGVAGGLCRRMWQHTAAGGLWSARLPPMIRRPSAQDGKQPGTLAPSGIEQVATRPCRAEGVLHDILCGVAITEQSERNPIEDGHMIAHPPVKLVTRDGGFGHANLCKSMQIHAVPSDQGHGRREHGRAALQKTIRSDPLKLFPTATGGDQKQRVFTWKLLHDRWGMDDFFHLKKRFLRVLCTRSRVV